MTDKPASVYLPEAGDIVWLDLNPRTGHEQSGRRPCIVISSHLFSEHTGMAVVCPITSRVRGLPFEIVMEGTETQGAILPIHLRSIDLASRYPKFIERAPGVILEQTRDYAQALISSD